MFNLCFEHTSVTDNPVTYSLCPSIENTTMPAKIDVPQLMKTTV